jgi:hypothetical protein
MAASCQSQAPAALYSPETFSFSDFGTHFCWRLSRPLGLVRLEELGKLKKKSFTSLDLEPAILRRVAKRMVQVHS